MLDDLLKQKENEDILNSNKMLEINRSCSYIIFLMKEIYEYHFAKSEEDGFYFYKLRNINNQNNKMRELLKELKKDD